MTSAEYAAKMFTMNMELKNLLHKASCDPNGRKYLVKEASGMIDKFYNLPSGMIVKKGR